MDAKKSLGQNFLRDEGVVKKIISAVSARAGEVIVEVGPGEGVLTEALAGSGATVIAIELDDRLIPVLKEKFRDFPNVHIVHEDILQINIGILFESYKLHVTSYKLVGNLPYYITSAIIRKFLEDACPPTEMFLMTQKEVAERICAKPGKMSVLSVAVQYYADPKLLFVVPKESFDPVPKVASAFLKISPSLSSPPVRGGDVGTPTEGVEDAITHKTEHGTRNAEYGMQNLQPGRKEFFRLVKMGFSARRKTLANNLANGLHIGKADVAKRLAEAGISEKARAQDLNVENWKVLKKIIF